MPVEELIPAVSMLSRSNSPVHITDTKGQLSGLLSSFSMKKINQKKSKKTKYSSRYGQINVFKRGHGVTRVRNRNNYTTNVMGGKNDEDRQEDR